jgi:hypothetical protein
MAYSDFTLNEVTKRFRLSLNEQADLFAATPETTPSELLREILAETVPLALAIHTEKARSELIVSPILVEVRKLAGHRVSLFSGVDFNVDQANGLNGVCDFILSRAPEQLMIRAPVLPVVEAKNDNIKGGLAQCLAEMVAAQMFNAREETGITTVWGVVTTGSIWRFMRLDGTTVLIDVPEYYLERVGKILGILRSIVEVQG